jgi:hypothetical protein
MNHEANSEFDMSQYEAMFDAENSLMLSRAEALRAVHKVWATIRKSNEDLPISRRFIIAGAANERVPVSHERVNVVPKPRAATVANIQVAWLSVPYLQESGVDKRLDTRIAFIELQRGDGEPTLHLLTEDEFTQYGSADEVLVLGGREDRRYSVVEYELDNRTASEKHLHEHDVLNELLTVLQAYDPDLQDNLPRL